MRTNVLVGVALLLFAAGLGVDRAWIRPVLERTRALEQQRDELQARLGARADLDVEAEVIAAGLGVANLEDLAGQAPEDPLVFLNRVIRASGLRQVEVVAEDVVETIRLRESGFTITVQGSHAGILGLVRELEDAARTVRVNGLVMGLPPEADAIECRLQLSIFDPLSKARS